MNPPSHSQTNQIVTYPAPSSMEPSPDFTLKVNGEPVFVYPARVSAIPLNQVWPGHQRSLDQTEIASFAYFDFSGEADLEIVSLRPVDQVTIRPVSMKISPSVAGNTIRLRLDHPCQLVVEINDWHHAFHLFANPIEPNPPKPGESGLHYFGPGVHEIGKFYLHSGQSVYIAGGAVVYGSINAEGADDIKISGRGILDASKFDRFEANQMIALKDCSQVEIEGIILRDANVYAVTPVFCEDVMISNIKVIGLWRYNSDGIDILNCHHVMVQDCFVRSFDDSLVIKGVCPPDSGSKFAEIRDVTFKNCVVWNDWGRALEIGAETQADVIRDIVFEDIDVIHYVHRAIDIQHCDRADIRDIRFEDIRVEEAITEGAGIENPKFDPGNASEVGTLIEFIIYKIMYSHDPQPGWIRNVVLKDIRVEASKFPPSNFYGFDLEHPIQDVSIVNLTILGRAVKTINDGNFRVNPYLKNLTIT